MAYSEKVIKHFNNPLNMGSFAKDDEGIGTGLAGAPECGDVMKLQIKVEDDRIVDVKAKTFGCGSAIASASSTPIAVSATLSPFVNACCDTVCPSNCTHMQIPLMQRNASVMPMNVVYQDLTYGSTGMAATIPMKTDAPRLFTIL